MNRVMFTGAQILPLPSGFPPQSLQLRCSPGAIGPQCLHIVKSGDQISAYSISAARLVTLADSGELVVPTPLGNLFLVAHQPRDVPSPREERRWWWSPLRGTVISVDVVKVLEEYFEN